MHISFGCAEYHHATIFTQPGSVNSLAVQPKPPTTVYIYVKYLQSQLAVLC
jgi:hypothetical protein